MDSKTRQISVINSLRGLAALVVCLFHFVVTTKDFIDTDILISIFKYGKKGVQLFFIISGIVIPLYMIKSRYKVRLFGKFLLRRFIRIEPPYLIAVVLGIIYLTARNYVGSSADIDLTPSLIDTLLHVGYLVPFVEGATWINPVFWTLSIEFQYYIFLAAMLPLALSEKKHLQWIFNLIILIIPFISSSDSFFPYWAAFFGMGIFYALYITKLRSKTELLILLSLCSLVVFFRQNHIDLLIGLGSLLTIHFFSDFKSKIGEFFGKISYSLYLLHTIIGSAFINFMSHRCTGSVEKFLVVISGLGLSIAAAYIFWKLIEKPSQHFARKVKIN